LDMILHMGFGFGINEVYIMSAHWIYAIPIAIGYLLKAMQGSWRKAVRLLLCCMTAYLYVYNGTLLLTYMMN